MHRADARMLPRRRAEWLLVIAVCGVFTLAFTYPIWTAPHYLLNDVGDARLITWTLAWGAHALTDASATVFDANIFYPRSNTLALSENVLGSMPLAAPFALGGQPVLGYNVVLLFSFFLFALNTTLWVRYLTGSLGAGLVAGVAAAFAPSRLDHLPQLQLLAAQWLPLGLLLVTRYADTARPRHLCAAAATMALQYWAGIQITMIFAPFVALYALAMIGARQPWRAATLTHVVGASALFIALVIPVSLPYLDAADEGMSRSLAEAANFSTQPKNFLSPSESNRMPHMVALRRHRGTEANHFAGVTLWALLFGAAGSFLWKRQRRDAARGWRHLLGLAVTGAGGMYALAVAAAFARADWTAGVVTVLSPLAPATLFCGGLVVLVLARRPRGGNSTVSTFGLLLALAMVGVLLSHGPFVRAWGSDLGVGPFRFLHEFGPYQSIRAVGRFGLATSLFLSAAAGVAVAALGPSGRRRTWLAAGVVGLLLLEYWAAPLAVTDVRSPDQPAYDALAEFPGTGAVLHVPVVPPPVPAATTEYLLGSTAHWRPLANGYSGFTARSILELSTIEPFSSRFFEYLAANAPVEYVVLHGRLLPRGAADSVRRAADASAQLEAVGEYGATVIYRRLRQPRRGPLVSERRAWGEAALQDLRREIRRTGPEPLDAEIAWGERVVAETSLTTDWTQVAIPPPLPADRSTDGSVDLSVRIASARTERWGRPLGDTGVAVRADILVDVQDGRLAVAVNDVWRAAEHTVQGIFLATLGEDGRYLRETYRFPADRNGIHDLAARIEALEAGTVTALGILSLDLDPSDAALPTLRKAIGAVGGRGRIDGDNLHRYALLGVRGAPAGSALEQHAFGRAAVRAGPRAARLPSLEVR